MSSLSFEVLDDDVGFAEGPGILPGRQTAIVSIDRSLE